MTALIAAPSLKTGIAAATLMGGESSWAEPCHGEARPGHQPEDQAWPVTAHLCDQPGREVDVSRRIDRGPHGAILEERQQRLQVVGGQALERPAHVVLSLQLAAQSSMPSPRVPLKRTCGDTASMEGLTCDRSRQAGGKECRVD